MSTLSSPTVTITVNAVSTDVTKSVVDKNYIERTSADGMSSLQHARQLTNKGRVRATARVYVTDDTADPVVSASASFIVDFPKGEGAWGEVAAKALVDFLSANTQEEIPLLVAGHNYG